MLQAEKYDSDFFSSPFVLMDPCGVASVFFWFYLRSVPKSDKREGDDMGGEMQDFFHPCHATLARIQPKPTRSQPQAMSRKQDVLGRSSAINHPVAFEFLQIKVSAHKDCFVCFFQNPRTGMERVDDVEDLSVIQEDKLPGLLVPRGGGLTSSFEEFLQGLIRDWLFFVFSDASTCDNCLKTVHILFLARLNWFFLYKPRDEWFRII